MRECFIEGFSTSTVGHCDGVSAERNCMEKQSLLRSKSFAGLLLAVGFSTSIAVPVARANLLSNGSFESPVVSANNVTLGILPTGWTQAGTSLPGIFNGNVSGWPSPQNGNQFVDIGNAGINAAISQGFTVITSGSYQLTWFDNTGTGLAAAYKVELLNSSSVVVATASESLTGTSLWNSRSLTGTLGIGNYTLKFTPTADRDHLFDSLLDNVSLSAAVPEPSTYIAGMLLLLPLGAGILRILRRKQAA